jgi:hypothetical protein
MAYDPFFVHDAPASVSRRINIGVEPCLSSAAVTANPDVTRLRKLCRERGLVTFGQDGLRKVMLGRTKVDEILRVTQTTA